MPPSVAKISPILQVQNITKQYPGVTAVDNVSFDMMVGEFHSIVGENGAGKSTLMKILSGVVTSYEGKILLNGKEVHFTGTRDAENVGVSIIHQELNLVDELTVAANIFLGREKINAIGLLDNDSMERETVKLFAQLECDIQASQLVRELRVGDQQLVEIAKALSFNSRILIMDEPTSALTESEVERLFRVIDQLQKSGVTILYISHKMEEVFRCSNRITVLRDGQFIQTVNTNESTPREITHLMVGREIEETQIGKNRSLGDLLLQVKHLSLPWKNHAKKWRLKDINFSLRKGEVLGIAGLMGAGRTELLETLFGISSEVPQGEIQLEGKIVSFTHPSEAIAAGLALVTEDRKKLGLFSEMSIQKNITICTLAEATTAGLISFQKEKKMASESINLLGIKATSPSVGMTTLSGGNQQKCIIARWLKTKPKVLLLDDPTRGIDVRAKSELYQIIDQLCTNGLGIVMTSSELPELITLCDRILVLREGELTAEFTRKEFTEQAIIEASVN
ncbi:Ribose ABC transport system, ATP-binding protein RbsA (TC 3.A.1.2.1) [hydrothermal vent metagenome]|uniref:Ribose ABC transport system, ATP-binding protein RbsA (TC 3.A.1.2.1) n=1 Tax=hydrothermal vent metagenome TaxID=652676 RepID=A0A3B1DU93_9ZZZZ